MPLIKDGKIIRTYEEQVQHLTEKHLEQENINKSLQLSESILQNNITEEKSARIQADENLRLDINRKQNNRADGDTRLQRNINSEAERAKSREDEIDADLATEILDRTNEDADLRNDIDANARDMIEYGKLPYISNNSTKFTDNGLSTYLIPLSDITPVSPVPIIGSVVLFQTDTSSYIGNVTAIQNSAVSVLAKQKINVNLYNTSVIVEFNSKYNKIKGTFNFNLSTKEDYTVIGTGNQFKDFINNFSTAANSSLINIPALGYFINETSEKCIIINQIQCIKSNNSILLYGINIQDVNNISVKSSFTYDEITETTIKSIINF